MTVRRHPILIATRVTAEQLEAIDHAARVADVSRSAFIRRIVRDATVEAQPSATSGLGENPLSYRES